MTSRDRRLLLNEFVRIAVNAETLEAAREGIEAALRSRGLDINRPKNVHTNDRMTPRKAEAIRNFYRRHRHWTQDELAERFNVHQGRISEVLGGKTNWPGRQYRRPVRLMRMDGTPL